MKKKQTDIQDLLDREQEIRSRISVELIDLLRCHDDLVEASRDFEQDYSRRVPYGDRHPISYFISRLRRNQDSVRMVHSSVGRLKSESYLKLMETLEELERQERGRQERKERKVTHA